MSRNAGLAIRFHRVAGMSELLQRHAHNYPLGCQSRAALAKVGRIIARSILGGYTIDGVLSSSANSWLSATKICCDAKWTAMIPFACAMPFKSAATRMIESTMWGSAVSASCTPNNSGTEISAAGYYRRPPGHSQSADTRAPVVCIRRSRDRLAPILELLRSIIPPLQTPTARVASPGR